MNEKVEKIIDDSPQDFYIFKSLVTMERKIKQYKNILCSISGGADSDIILDLCTKFDTEKKIIYAFYDTGLEYVATKKHLDYLEKKYGIEIKREKAIKPVAVGCKQYGQPFLSKRLSQNISRLQKHNFQWENDKFEDLCIRYPKCKSALKWWCNEWGEESQFNVSRYPYLKEFMIESPPNFLISDKCCDGAKKKVSMALKDKYNCDLNITGLRKAEGGGRSTAIKSCFSENEAGANYRPIFFYSDKTKEIYNEHYEIQNSDCYSMYGLKRTGCAGCPFGLKFEYELEVLEKYEPRLYKVANHVFRDSYEYTRKYKKYRQQRKIEEKEKETGHQIHIDEFENVV